MLDSTGWRNTVNSDSSADDPSDDDAFVCRSQTDCSTRNVVDHLLHSSSKDVVSIAAWPDLKDLFIRRNTPLPVSAAVERLFSCVGLITNDRRTRPTDKNLDKLVLLKVNSWKETKYTELWIYLNALI